MQASPAAPGPSFHPTVYDHLLLFEHSISAYWVGFYQESWDACQTLLAKGLPEYLEEAVRYNMKFARQRLDEQAKAAASLPKQAKQPCLQVPLAGNNEVAGYSLVSKHARHPLKFRPNTSDAAVFQQIFVEREYACLDDVAAAGLILDCGAYVGYSCAYFLTRFPGCKLIAIEPDPANFELLCHNLAPYGDAAEMIPAAVWSRPVRLAFAETQYRDGREWTKHVRACTPGESGSVQAEDIGSLLARTGHERISILKMDIEGAEVQVFSENYEAWIDRVDNLVIELHNDSMFGNADAVFARAIAGRGFTVSRSGELTVCKSPGMMNAERCTSLVPVRRPPP